MAQPRPIMTSTRHLMRPVEEATIERHNTPPEARWALWYPAPAETWEQALPVGNGALGAMVFGGVKREHLQLNDEGVWAGGPKDRVNPDGLRALPEIRAQLFAGRIAEATALAEKTMLGIPPRIDPFEPLGDLYIDMLHIGSVTGYRRELDLERGIAVTRFTHADTTILRHVFASATDQVLVIHLSALQPGALAFDLRLRRAKGARTRTHGPAIRLSGACGDDGIRFCAEARIDSLGGTVAENPFGITVSGADAAIIILASATSLRHQDPEAVVAERLRKARERGYPRIYRDHTRDHCALFNRVRINLGRDPHAALPTDHRLAVYGKGAADPHLEALLFQYGRYLLADSSRPGGLPANLQGIWCKDFQPAWNSDFHTNINLQMNYWHAETTALPECHLPLFDLMESLVEPGQDVAKRLYGAGGWVLHHLTDAFGTATPCDGVQGIWPMGAAWLCQHPWWHYEFNGDIDFLRRRAYPLLKGASEFMLDFLIEAPAGTPVAGHLVTNPSHSPENSFTTADGERHKFTYGATMDLMIIDDLFRNTIDAARRLDLDAPFRQRLQAALDRLPPLRISPRTGALQEWLEDYDEPQPQHRHVSHMFALHPGCRITPEETPELAAAIRTTLDRRGDGGTGWSKAWKINAWARLHDGDRAHKLLRELLTHSILPNLFDTHPPFQIDGNFGAAAGIAEMLLQSHRAAPDDGHDGPPRRVIHLLPALPAAWPNGSVSGLRARGAVAVDIGWHDGALTEAALVAEHAGPLHLRYRGVTITRQAKAGAPLRLTAADFA